VRIGAKAVVAVLGLLMITLAGSPGWPAALTGADLGRTPAGKKQPTKAGNAARGKARPEGGNIGRQSRASRDRSKEGRPGRPAALSGSDLRAPSGGIHAAKRRTTAKVRIPGRGRRKSQRDTTSTIVPSLVGQSQSWAKSKATAAGLGWKAFADPNSTRHKWTVSRQSPPPGTKVKRGSWVIIWVAGLQGTPDSDFQKKRAAALRAADVARKRRPK